MGELEGGMRIWLRPSWKWLLQQFLPSGGFAAVRIGSLA